MILVSNPTLVFALRIPQTTSIGFGMTIFSLVKRNFSGFAAIAVLPPLLAPGQGVEI